MPALEVMDLIHDAVLWEVTGLSDRSGNALVGEPVQIRCRWVGKRREIHDDKGQTIALEARVIVKRDIAVGSRMWLGTLDAWNGTGSAGAGTEVLTVAFSGKTDDLKGRATRRWVDLTKYKESPEE